MLFADYGCKLSCQRNGRQQFELSSTDFFQYNLIFLTSILRLFNDPPSQGSDGWRSMSRISFYELALLIAHLRLDAAGLAYLTNIIQRDRQVTRKAIFPDLSEDLGVIVTTSILSAQDIRFEWIDQIPISVSFQTGKR